MNRAGKVAVRAARAIVTQPSSSGWRSTSSTRRSNSGISSRNSTPWWARLISPGPRLRAAADQRDVGDGVVRRAERPLAQQADAGRQQAAHRVDRASPRAPRRTSAAAGSPAPAAPSSSCRRPGGPTIRRLWPPAAAISSARRASACPLTSAKSADGRASVGRRPAGAAPRGGRAGRSARATASASESHRDDARAPRRPPPRRALADGSRIEREPVAPRGGGDRQHAARGLDAAVERQFAEQHDVVHLRAASTTPLAARTPRAIGRSNDEPALRTSAGARFTVTRCGGNSKPEFRMALRTRSRLSRTLGSGRPTIVNDGKPKRDVHLDVDRDRPRCRRRRRSAGRRARLVHLQAPRRAPGGRRESRRNAIAERVVARDRLRAVVSLCCAGRGGNLG